MLRAPCSLSTQATEPPLGAAVKSDGNGALRICSRVNFLVGAAKEMAHARDKTRSFREAIRLCYTLKRRSATDPRLCYRTATVRESVYINSYVKLLQGSRDCPRRRNNQRSIPQDRSEISGT